MPHILPAAPPINYITRPGVAPSPDIDTGGYDFTIGGHGFRFASDTQNPYQRFSEPTTVHRFDNSLEPGEQTLSELPWIKSQASFHGGAGQLNLEQGFTAFQYQQEQVEHLRFDASLGVDVWTPGQTVRLPDTRLDGLTGSGSSLVTAVHDGVDYAVVGGVGMLTQVSWPSGPDAALAYTEIDLSGSIFGGAANCTVTSLATDGTNYYALIQLAVVPSGGNVGCLTYIVSGSITSAAAPKVLYTVAKSAGFSDRHNLCSNPSFETDVSGWANGNAYGSVARSTAQAKFGSASMLSTWGSDAANAESVSLSFTSVPGRQYALSAYVYVPAGNPRVAVAGVTLYGWAPAAGATSPPNGSYDAWERLYVSFVATSTTSYVTLRAYDAPVDGQTAYFDGILIEDSNALGDYFDGDTADTTDYNFTWDGTAKLSTSTATGIGVAAQVNGVIGWVKSRLMAGLGGNVYELAPTGAGFASLPTPKYTSPLTLEPGQTLYTEISESPTGILIVATYGGQSSLMQMTLDTTGGTPTLSGASVIAILPPGESIYAMRSYLGSFLAIGTTSGIRVGTFDTYTGALSYGPLSVTTSSPVYALCGRDRFVYGSYSNQQEDGTTGLVRVDLTQPVDASGRLAYAADLRPPTTATYLTGTVYGVDILPSQNRIVFLTEHGLHVEGAGPGDDGVAWIRTSRIRFDTAEPKLWVSGRLHGTIDKATIQVTGVTPFGLDDENLGTFGFIVSNDDSKIEFGMPPGLHEWIQLKFTLVGSAAVLNTYQAKALPSPVRQHIIQVSANCFSNESDRFGLDVTDPETPRTRWQNVADLESAGNAVRYVEFTNSGSVGTLVYIDQIQFSSTSRPTIDDDFGGVISLKLRIVSGD